MVGDLFVNLDFEDFRKAGQGRMDIRLQQFGSRVSPHLKREMTVVALKYLGISDDTIEQASNRGCKNCGRSF
jgi:hypothetical protein